MKEKILDFIIDTDVNNIECNLSCAEVIVAQAEDETFKVSYPNTKNVRVGNGESGLIIYQGRRSLFTRAKQTVKLFVPAHTTPSLKTFGKNFDLTVSGGIYGELVLSADEGRVSLTGCAFESVEITGGDVDVSLSDATVKDGLLAEIKRGDAVAEDSFITRAEYRLKRGNVGLFNLTCKDCVAETEKGNVSATMAGGEEQFSFTLMAKEGTVNRENAKREGAEFNFQAYSMEGNVTLDFVEQKEND